MLHFVTVASHAEIGQAVALARSVGRHHSDSVVHLLVTDPLELALPPTLRLIPPEPLTAGDLRFRELLATTLTPHRRQLAMSLALAHVIDGVDEDDVVVYLAPTVEVLGALDGLAATVDRGRGLCFVRVDTTPPRDGRRPDAADVALLGSVRPGIAIANATGRGALDRWTHLVAQLWLRDEPVSFARLASVLTETDQSCGTVARVGFADGLMMCLSGERHGSETDVLLDGSRVLAYDFAEHDPSHPHRIVGSIPDARRSLADHDALARLHQERAERVRASDGEWRIVGGEHLQIASGVAFDDVMRCRYTRALRDAVAASKPHPPCPLDVPADFARWIAASDYDGPLPLSRYLDEIRLSRPDLLDAFPEVPGRSVAGMLQWARQHGASEHAIPPFLVPEPPPDPDRPATLLPGVNLAGFLSAELGVGEVARRLATAMDAVGVPYSTYTFDRTQSRQQAQPVAADGELRYDTNVVCVNADSMGVFVQRVGPAFSAGRRRIGVWFWETSELAPMFHPAFGDVDELWAASDYVAEALRAAAPEDVSVLRFPLPIVEPVVQPGATRASLGLPTDRFVFLFSFDYLSVAQRKNPYGLVEAFRAAFAPNEGPVLVVKSINADKRPDDATRLRWVARGRDDIVLRDGYLDAPANAALLQLADCFVSLHRSEGFGFNIADAMALGTPVIATGYSGNLTFMRDDDCALVRYQEVEVGPGHFPYPARSRWAEPDLDHAATLMRAVVDDPHAARERARRARERVLREFSPTRTGEFIRDRIVALRDQTTTEPSNQPAPRPAPRRGLSRRRRP